ncbi:hypothetical protein MPSEU_000940200 [Mayamaea pseudoterrestris]|nr:hypothetical protein MPSEU_000940200 [Mayamaea pseudoterrestris]
MKLARAVAVLVATTLSSRPRIATDSKKSKRPLKQSSFVGDLFHVGVKSTKQLAKATKDAILLSNPTLHYKFAKNPLFQEPQEASTELDSEAVNRTIDLDLVHLDAFNQHEGPTATYSKMPVNASLHYKKLLSFAQDNGWNAFNQMNQYEETDSSFINIDAWFLRSSTFMHNKTPFDSSPMTFTDEFSLVNNKRINSFDDQLALAEVESDSETFDENVMDESAVEKENDADYEEEQAESWIEVMLGWFDRFSFIIECFWESGMVWPIWFWMLHKIFGRRRSAATPSPVVAMPSTTRKTKSNNGRNRRKRREARRNRTAELQLENEQAHASTPLVVESASAPLKTDDDCLDEFFDALSAEATADECEDRDKSAVAAAAATLADKVIKEGQCEAVHFAMEEALSTSDTPAVAPTPAVKLAAATESIGKVDVEESLSASDNLTVAPISPASTVAKNNFITQDVVDFDVSAVASIQIAETASQVAQDGTDKNTLAVVPILVAEQVGKDIAVIEFDNKEDLSTVATTAFDDDSMDSFQNQPMEPGAILASTSHDSRTTTRHTPKSAIAITKANSKAVHARSKKEKTLTKAATQDSDKRDAYQENSRLTEGDQPSTTTRTRTRGRRGRRGRKLAGVNATAATAIQPVPPAFQLVDQNYPSLATTTMAPTTSAKPKNMKASNNLLERLQRSQRRKLLMHCRPAAQAASPAHCKDSVKESVLKVPADVVGQGSNEAVADFLTNPDAQESNVTQDVNSKQQLTHQSTSELICEPQSSASAYINAATKGLITVTEVPIACEQVACSAAKSQCDPWIYGDPLPTRLRRFGPIREGCRWGDLSSDSEEEEADAVAASNPLVAEETIKSTCDPWIYGDPLPTRPRRFGPIREGCRWGDLSSDSEEEEDAVAASNPLVTEETIKSTCDPLPTRPRRFGPIREGCRWGDLSSDSEEEEDLPAGYVSDDDNW